MRLYQLTRIGANHVNHCEDYTVTESLRGGRTLCAVMDGCSMGTDSYLAATLTGKLFRKIARERSLYNRSSAIDCHSELKEIMWALITELNQIKQRLALQDDELLNTVILAVLDFKTDEGCILTVGDGLICVNGTLTEYKQNNTPDYLGYHLRDDFDTWFTAQQQVLSVSGLGDISLSTDGIYTFEQYTPGSFPEAPDPIDYLLRNPDDLALPNMLLKKVVTLEQEFGLRPGDDLGIIRVCR